MSLKKREGGASTGDEEASRRGGQGMKEGDEQSLKIQNPSGYAEDDHNPTDRPHFILIPELETAPRLPLLVKEVGRIPLVATG
jgi:hypothetical protein